MKKEQSLKKRAIRPCVSLDESGRRSARDTNMKTVIVSLSSKNIHKMPAAWMIKAYCDEQICGKIEVIEGSINEKPRDILARIINSRPDIIGFSSYIWNIEYICKIIPDLKQLLPNVFVVLGGPEVSFETDFSKISFADAIIRGPGEKAFCELIIKIQNGQNMKREIVDGCGKNFESFPNSLSEEFFLSFIYEQIPQIENRLIYYESSRGCPFSCSYCLSSAYSGVETYSLERVYSDLKLLVEKGAKVIKFTDRTFNADKKRCAAVLEFIGALNTDCVFHFEVAADLFNDEILNIVKALPKNRVQFEIGIQSVNDETLKAVNRKTDTNTALKNIGTLVNFENCHIHADLIAGLPFETLETFKNGVNKVLKTKPHCLQLGFLKILKGSKMSADKAGALFSLSAPYEVLKTDIMSFEDINYLKEIETVVEKFYNSGKFNSSVQLCVENIYENDYFRFFSDLYLFNEKQNFNMNLKNSYLFLWEFLKTKLPQSAADELIIKDCQRCKDPRAMPDELREKKKNSRFD